MLSALQIVCVLIVRLFVYFFRLEAKLPKTFQSLSVRVYSRDPLKNNLLAHAFQSLTSNRDVIATLGPEMSSPERRPPVMLSQEDEDMDGRTPSDNDAGDDEEINLQPDIRSPSRPERGRPLPNSVTPKRGHH